MPTELKLHLGCGEVKLDGFVNIDMKKTLATDRVMDVRKLDYPDNSIEKIYASHIFEHFSPKEAKDILKEWGRVLKERGEMIIAIPNFDKFFSRYLFFTWILKDKEKTNNLLAELVAGGLDYKIEDYHKIIFNPQKFNDLAKEAGFKKIERINLKNGNFPIPGINPKNFHSLSMVFLLTK